MMVIVDLIQMSPEWFAARAGIPTASGFDKIITTKGEPSKQAKKYLYQLAGERITGIKEEGYQNAAMQRGIELEQEAREFYELTHSVDIRQVGICYRDAKKKMSCSPDGLVGDDGVIEIKCPIISTHVGYLLDNKLPLEYFQQVQGQLFVTGRKWCDFISYYGSMKPLIVRVTPDVEFIMKLQVALDSFCKDLEAVTEKVR